MRREEINCFGCGNKAVIVIKDAEVIDHVDYCPFCGADLIHDDELHDMMGEIDEPEDI